MNLWIVAAIVSSGTALVLLGQLNIIKTFEGELHRRTRFLNGRIKMAQQSIVDALVAQLTKAKGEIVAKLEAAVADAQAQVDAAGATDLVDLSALTAIAQQLDDLVPDEDEAAEAVDEAVEEAEEADEVGYTEDDEVESDEVADDEATEGR